MKSFLGGLLSCVLILPCWVVAGSTLNIEKNSGTAALADTTKVDASGALVDRLSEISTFQSRFHQILSDKDGKVLQETDGDFKLIKPGKFYWQVEPPYEQLVVSNGVKLWVYDADLEQATVRSSRELKHTPAQILSGDSATISAAYNTVRSQGGGRVMFDLEPKTKSDFARIRFVFEKTQLHSFEIVDKLGQVTLVEFHNVVLNKALAPKLFNFVPPEGTDIIVND